MKQVWERSEVVGRYKDEMKSLRGEIDEYRDGNKHVESQWTWFRV